MLLPAAFAIMLERRKEFPTLRFEEHFLPTKAISKILLPVKMGEINAAEVYVCAGIKE